jgi:hypothetical protein
VTDWNVAGIKYQPPSDQPLVTNATNSAPFRLTLGNINCGGNAVTILDFTGDKYKCVINGTINYEPVADPGGGTLIYAGDGGYFRFGELRLADFGLPSQTGTIGNVVVMGGTIENKHIGTIEIDDGWSLNQNQVKVLGGGDVVDSVTFQGSSSDVRNAASEFSGGIFCSGDASFKRSLGPGFDNTEGDRRQMLATTEDLGTSPTSAPTGSYDEPVIVRNSNADNNETWTRIGGTWVQIV